ncbi:hypothetical protein [Clostridium sp.]
MNRKYRALSAIATLMNEITFFYNAFLIVSLAKTKNIMWIDYWAWACGGAAILLWNRWFLQKARSLVSIIAVNTLIASLWLFLVSRYFFHIQGMTAYGFAIIFLIATTVRAIYLSMHEVPGQRMVTYTELCIVGTCFFFFIQMGPLIMPMSYNIPSIAVVLVNILALINIRLFSENAHEVDISKMRRGIFLISGFVILIGGIAGGLTYVSASFKGFVLQVITTVKGIIIPVFSFFNRLLELFFMRVKPREYSGKDTIDLKKIFRFKMPKVGKQVSLNIDVFRFMPWILILLVITILVYLFNKYRKRVFRRGTVPVTIMQKRIKRDLQLWSGFKSYMKFLHRKAFLLYLSIRMRHTPQGLFLMIERWGRYSGFPRIVCETPGTYLNRLMNCKEWNKGLKETHTKEIVQHLIKELEWMFYSKGGDIVHPRRISKSELKVLMPYFHIGIWSKK